MNATLSNHLTDLAERVKEAERRAVSAEVETLTQSIAAGSLLIEAKAAVDHGEWLLFLERSEVSIRRAQRLMRVAASGLDVAAIADLGGLRPATDFIREWGLHTPHAGDAMLLENVLAGPDEVEHPVAYVWKADQYSRHYHAAVVSSDRVFQTEEPMPQMIEVEGDRPVPALVHWLLTNFPVPIGAWRMTRVPVRLVEALGITAATPSTSLARPD